MELVENLPILKINYLKEMSFKDFKIFCSTNAKSEIERIKQYEILQGFCKANIKARGQITRIYSFTQKTPLEVGGRLYCGNSLQSLGKQFRGFLCDDITTDIDMKNAHPTIARYLCKLHGIPCPNLSYYIDNRNEILSQFGSDGKGMFLKALNDDKLNKKEKHKFFKDFDTECKYIQKMITTIPEYSHIVNSVPETKLYNWLGSAFNRIMCVYENKILHSLISILNQKQITICSLAFDGLLMYGNHYDNSDLLQEITTFIETQWIGLNMKWSYKQHSTDIEMPDEWDIPKKVDINSYDDVKTNFEKTRCKIINKTFFIREFENRIIVYNKEKFTIAFEDIHYQTLNESGDVGKSQFLIDWYKDDQKRSYDDVGVFPTGRKCPDNYFNMWREFDMELVTEWTPMPDAVAIFRKHILILCGNDPVISDYFEKWIAQMIQYPAVKSICPVLISKEGAGKGTLIQLFTKMMGSTKVFETTQPSRDVWGEFNGLMADAFFVNLNELSKKETMESEGRIKGLITDSTLKINNKGVAQFPIESFHRFMITTNNENPISTTVDDRRKLIIQSSNELIGNNVYFDGIYKLLGDVNVVKSCYEYFKSIPNMDTFGTIPLPETEYHSELKELSTTPIESWIKEFILENYYEKVEMRKQGKEWYDLFIAWSKKCGLEYTCTLQAFGLRVKNLKINGISKGQKTNKGETICFNIELMRTHFKMIEDIELTNDVEECE